jgi:hypothetical protein
MSKLSEENIYLSIVVASRNDNHGGDMLKRMSTFMNSVFHWSTKKSFLVELIIVEWNPPENRKLLKDELPKPTDKFTQLKYIVVPREIHSTYKNSAVIPLYQMIAKNVGIARAKGEFILCTNIDIIFSKENFEFLAEKKLKKGFYYRANRVDVHKEIMSEIDTEPQLLFAKKKENVIKRMGKTQGYESLHLPAFFYNFPRFCRLLNSFLIFTWKKTHKGQFAHFAVDFDACGDYTLMAKSDWEKIQGYVELDMYSIHIDSMALWSAHAVGIKQYIFPFLAPVYHIDHEDGWESKDAVKTIKFLESKPCLDYSIVHKAGLQIIKQKKPWNINDENWGMKNIVLDEYSF